MKAKVDCAISEASIIDFCNELELTPPVLVVIKVSKEQLFFALHPVEVLNRQMNSLGFYFHLEFLDREDGYWELTDNDKKIWSVGA